VRSGCLTGLILATGPRTVACALALALTTPPEAAPISWPVEYARGDIPSVVAHKNLTLQAADGSIRVLRGNEVLRTIPGASVVGVVYDVAAYHPVVGYLGGAAGMSPSSGEGFMAGAGVMLYGLVVVVIPLLLAPIVKTQHFVTLVWREGDLVRDATLQVKGSERQAILSALSAQAGVAWRDAPAERDRLAADLDAAESRSFAFDLDREVSVAGTYLSAGRHRAVVLDRVGGPELILFKSNSYNSRDALVATPVKRAPSAGPDAPAAAAGATAAGTIASGAREATVTYLEKPAGATIKELRAGEKLLTLPDFIPAPPGTPQPVAGTNGTVVEIAFGQYAVGTITRTEYEGEAAFRFLARRTDLSFRVWTNPYRPADLYVTRQRIVFDPGDTDASRGRRVVLERSAITEVRSGSSYNRMTFHLAAGKEKHAFSLRAPGRGQSDESRTPLDHGRSRLVETRLADFARLAIRDFDAAMSLYDGWLAGVPTLAPPEVEQSEPGAESGPADPPPRNP
jgi:hypothetical protein